MAGPAHRATALPASTPCSVLREGRIESRLRYTQNALLDESIEDRAGSRALGHRHPSSESHLTHGLRPGSAIKDGPRAGSTGQVRQQPFAPHPVDAGLPLFFFTRRSAASTLLRSTASSNGFSSSLPSARVRAPSVAIHRHVFPLGFTLPADGGSSRLDSHHQDSAHAGRTTKKGRRPFGHRPSSFTCPVSHEAGSMAVGTTSGCRRGHRRRRRRRRRRRGSDALRPR